MISVIVPIYNAKAYLERCVQSILSQTYTNLEVLLIDDGSTDGTGELCDQWAEKDSRVRVIHQENAGVSAARNAGINSAKGEWISFVDVDDWVDTQMLEQAVAAAQLHKADMVLFDPYVHMEGKEQVHVDSIHFWPESTAVKKGDITPERLRFVAGAIWRCIYRRSMLEENNIRYITTLPLSEDRIFNMTAIGCSKTLYYLRKPFYHYWINSGSATGKYRQNMLEVVLTTQEQTERVLLRYWDESYIPIYERVNIVDGALLCVYNIFSPKNKSNIANKYREVRKVVTNEKICAAYEKLEKLTVRQWLVKHKCCTMLCMVGIAWNMKNR